MSDRFVFLWVPIGVCVLIRLGQYALFYEKLKHLQSVLEPILENIDIPIVAPVLLTIIHVNQYAHFRFIRSVLQHLKRLGF